MTKYKLTIHTKNSGQKEITVSSNKPEDIKSEIIHISTTRGFFYTYMDERFYIPPHEITKIGLEEKTT